MLGSPPMSQLTVGVQSNGGSDTGGFVPLITEEQP